jgi:hypothetical protein
MRKNRSIHHLLRFFFEYLDLSTRIVMLVELHRDQVTELQTIHENLRDAAYHEAGHVVVARFLGLTIGRVEIEEDGSGRADIRYAEHLPLVDQIAICVAGIEAQELFNCPMHQHAALGDYLRVRELLAGLTDTESYEHRQAGYLRALEILKVRLPEIENLADRLFKQRRIAA